MVHTIISKAKKQPSDNQVQEPLEGYELSQGTVPPTILEVARRAYFFEGTLAGVALKGNQKKNHWW